jgi:hypothetical protein
VISDKESYELVKQELKNSFGDDLERAEAAFRGLSQEAMNKNYGESGKTRHEILEGYRQDRSRRVKALHWLESLEAH